MHNALLISEILGYIIHHLEGDTEELQSPTVHVRDSQQALAALARTCRAFSKPALDALWRRLHSLQPFFQLLRTDDGTISFDDHIILRYTPRVQELLIDYNDNSAGILQILSEFITPSLPNLRKLIWLHDPDELDSESVSAIRFLLGPSLVHLHVDLGPGDHSSLLDVLECYHTLSPNVKSLHLEYQSWCPRHVITAVSRSISCSKNLESLTCKAIDEAALFHVMKSRSLRRLCAYWPSYKPDTLRRVAYTISDHPPFENLRVLELHVQDLTSIIPFFKSHQQPFEDISFTLRIFPSYEVLHEFFTALSSTTRQRTLRRIHLSHKLHARDNGDEKPFEALDFQLLSLLIPFNLRVLDVDFRIPVVLADDKLAWLAQAWPDLEVFHFSDRAIDPTNQSVASSVYPLPTLRGLLFLIARCQKLRVLGLRVDSRDVPTLSEEEEEICNTVFSKLFLADSHTKGQVARVAQFLFDHFSSAMVDIIARRGEIARIREAISLRNVRA